MHSILEEKNSIDILLVDDHEMFRQGLARALDKEPSMRIVGQAGSVAEALSQLKTTKATMVVLDVDLGNDRGLDFVLEARKSGYSGGILVVTAGLSGPEALQLVQSGAGGILHKHHSIESLRSALHKVAEGGAYLEESYLPSLFKSLDRTAKRKPELSDREKRILRSILEGLTNKEIGVRLDTTEGSVKSALRQLFEKLGVHTRAQLVKVALEKFRDQL